MGFVRISICILTRCTIRNPHLTRGFIWLVVLSFCVYTGQFANKPTRGLVEVNSPTANL